MSMTNKENLELIQFVSDVAKNAKLKNTVMEITKDKLGPITRYSNELKLIAEDLLSTKLIRLLEQIHEGKFTLDMSLPDEQKRAIVFTFFKKAVTNECNRKLSNWSNDHRNGKFGARARVVLSPDEHNDPDGLVKLILSENDEVVLNQNSESLQVLLDELNLSEEDKWILSQRGQATQETELSKRPKPPTYKELALQYGGTEDKYRKMFNRALVKAKTNLKNTAYWRLHETDA
ncbi:hypothetical protein K08M3_40640 [Vibrio alginolyticus]|uniref:Uncharacterized protein n=2 Tax=Vibrio alginolyticus TaxID=663 RepID=A0A1W6TIX1_VIBAL|nr:hypothetical protein [Vibrio alginolyticus]ARP00904.1 hypothetical protein K01M1_40790 [Vibrio alginolyticus]ARP05604.1 hypothetical protein K04M1_40720 [Vibrio alginolyticus]ARP10662.1 hypothetical protein K04M3_40740 [Vibrio alginolyticus]ARP15761.1 hypothetical protein K04M5_41000 [Vibrio alginolyticus]ARP20815.1 hypothetical protein K05K4_40950 [Vibrio alginolyticus]